MDKAELLSTFRDHVEQFDRFQSFIDKAKQSGGKFAAAVVEKVIQDNEGKCIELVAEIMPLMSQMEAVIAGLADEKQAIIDGRQDSEFKLQELELRREIGDLSEPEFEKEAAEFKAVVDSTDAKVSELEMEGEEFIDLMERWRNLAERSGVLDEASAAPPPARPQPPARQQPRAPEPKRSERPAPERQVRAPVPEPEPEPEPEPDPLDDLVDDPVLDLGDAPEADGVFDDDGVGFELGDLDILGDDDDLDLDGGNDEAANESRRSVLLYQEGTAEEQIYPFNGEVMSLGRGRDNDVQVKNDSKVSRYHCKLYRRGPNFYIEDNKSANGTLVNGELITERRLFGGEEVIIGETFFRFRILD
ncbi:MAG: FHA domain-containing protein [Alphaproteobacteria bacterium]|nr:FHA domain-containing protein [Alphaproteobacteria bacterium]